MEKVLKFLNKWGVLILICLSMFILMGQCSSKSATKKSNKIFKEYVAQEAKQDSVLNASLYTIEHKLDSTLISNVAVVNANKATSSAIKENSKQQVVVKVVPQTIEQK